MYRVKKISEILILIIYFAIDCYNKWFNCLSKMWVLNKYCDCARVGSMRVIERKIVARNKYGRDVFNNHDLEKHEKDTVFQTKFRKAAKQSGGRAIFDLRNTQNHEYEIQHF